MLSYSYPHVAPDLRSTVFGRMQDHFTTHKPGSVDLGNSFLALLSGSPSCCSVIFRNFHVQNHLVPMVNLLLITAMSM